MLVLVPTRFELDLLTSLAQRRFPAFIGRVCGFGPLSAALGTAQAILIERPSRVCLLGLAGTFDEKLIGTAAGFESTRLDGIGIPKDGRLLSGHALGFDDRLPDQLQLDTTDFVGPTLPGILTVCVPSDNADEASRRQQVHPEMFGEDMESYAVAAACRQFNVPLTVIRGFSNVVGDRDKRKWCFEAALAAAFELYLQNTQPDSLGDETS